MRIAIISAVWGRLLTTRLWWLACTRLREQWAPHAVGVFVAGSEEDHRTLAVDFGGVWVEHPNLLGGKFNAAAERAWTWGADYVVVLGSDDVMTPALAEPYRVTMEAGAQYFGLRGCHMIEPVTRRALTLRGHASRTRWGETVGAGRALSRVVLDKVQGRPWPDKLTRGADWRMTLKLQKYGIAGVDVILEGHEDAPLIDVKGGGNMWKFDHVAQHTHVTSPADYEMLVAKLPEVEQQIIRQLEQAHCPVCGTLRSW
jgi:hypothetical protein